MYTGKLHGFPDTQGTGAPEIEETDEDYIPRELNENSDDNDDDSDGGRDDAIDPPKDPVDINASDNDNMAIMFKPAGPEHDNTVVGVTTDQYHTAVDTETSGKTADTVGKITHCQYETRIDQSSQTLSI